VVEILAMVEHLCVFAKSWHGASAVDAPGQLKFWKS